MWWCGHPGGIILEAPQEYCSSPLQHRLWFSTVNKHDVVLTVIAQTGMFLFWLLFFIPTHSFTCLHVALREKKKTWFCMVYFRPLLLKLFKQRTDKFFGGRFSAVNSISQNYYWYCDCDLLLPGATPASWQSSVFNYTSSSIILWLFYSLILHAFLFYSTAQLTVRCIGSGCHC